MDNVTKCLGIPGIDRLPFGPSLQIHIWYSDIRSIEFCMKKIIVLRLDQCTLNLVDDVKEVRIAQIWSQSGEISTSAI